MKIHLPSTVYVTIHGPTEQPFGSHLKQTNKKKKSSFSLKQIHTLGHADFSGH